MVKTVSGISIVRVACIDFWFAPSSYPSLEELIQG